jgi:stress-induced morphogen
MAIALDEVRLLIEAALPGATVEISDDTGTQDHLSATVTAPQFEGLSRIEQHRLVKKACQARFDDGSIHALSIRTLVADG